jgi:hypothetical protein
MAGWAGSSVAAILSQMNGGEEAKMRRTRRFTRWLERTLLGAAMIVVARVVERRILRAVERRHA